MHVGCFGLSGAGKTHLASEVAKMCPSYFCTSASNLIKGSGGTISFRALSKERVGLNQSYLVQRYRDLKLSYADTFVEFHNLIETVSGNEWIADEVLVNLDIDVATFLLTPPDVIKRNRMKDSFFRERRLKVSSKEIDKLQRQALYRLRGVYPDLLVLPWQKAVVSLTKYMGCRS